jgi:hypothetical protein
LAIILSAAHDVQAFLSWDQGGSTTRDTATPINFGESIQPGIGQYADPFEVLAVAPSQDGGVVSRINSDRTLVSSTIIPVVPPTAAARRARVDPSRDRRLSI